jgi:hypothetical protein
MPGEKEEKQESRHAHDRQGDEEDATADIGLGPGHPAISLPD